MPAARESSLNPSALRISRPLALVCAGLVGLTIAGAAAALFASGGIEAASGRLAGRNLQTLTLLQSSDRLMMVNTGRYYQLLSSRNAAEVARLQSAIDADWRAFAADSARLDGLIADPKLRQQWQAAEALRERALAGWRDARRLFGAADYAAALRVFHSRYVAASEQREAVVRGMMASSRDRLYETKISLGELIAGSRNLLLGALATCLLLAGILAAAGWRAVRVLPRGGVRARVGKPSRKEAPLRFAGADAGARGAPAQPWDGRERRGPNRARNVVRLQGPATRSVPPPGGAERRRGANRSGGDSASGTGSDGQPPRAGDADPDRQES